jgi:hypothetical protein
MFGAISSISTDWYKDDIENLNIESRKVLEKIDLKLGE